MKNKDKFSKRNPRSIGKRKYKLEKLEIEELENLKNDYVHNDRTENTDEKE